MQLKIAPHCVFVLSVNVRLKNIDTSSRLAFSAILIRETHAKCSHRNEVLNTVIESVMWVLL